MNKYIKIDPRVCNGKPVISGTRIPVTVILDHLSAGETVQKITNKFPGLKKEQVYGILQYCHSVIEHTELEPQP